MGRVDRGGEARGMTIRGFLIRRDPARPAAEQGRG